MYGKKTEFLITRHPHPFIDDIEEFANRHYTILNSLRFKDDKPDLSSSLLRYKEIPCIPKKFHKYSFIWELKFNGKLPKLYMIDEEHSEVKNAEILGAIKRAYRIDTGHDA